MKTGTNDYGFFRARVWQGMPMSIWLRLLSQNSFAVSPNRLAQALRMTFFAGVNSVLHQMDHAFYQRQVAHLPLAAPPLFIIGHWRTGTTWLHELLVLDQQFGFPTTYQCMAPHHFLLTDPIVPRFLRHLLPSHRPMDNMMVGFDRPQEDELALCNLGVPSPYLKWMFPNRDSGCEQYLDLEGLSPRELKRWSDALVGFLRRVTFRYPRRLVLKSPTHTARVGNLRNIFPGAQFIHIVRHPFVVFPSTVHTWKQLWTTMGYQVSTFAGIEEYVLATFERMYQSFEKSRPLLDEHHLYEIRYEDLVLDPIGEVSKIYDRLKLGDFEKVRPLLEQTQAQTRSYRTNKYDLPETLQGVIAERWKGYFERYGYARSAASSAGAEGQTQP